MEFPQAKSIVLNEIAKLDAYQYLRGAIDAIEAAQALVAPAQGQLASLNKTILERTEALKQLSSVYDKAEAELAVTRQASRNAQALREEEAQEHALEQLRLVQDESKSLTLTLEQERNILTYLGDQVAEARGVLAGLRLSVADAQDQRAQLLKALQAA